MNHTTNYQLSQWEATDKVQRTDFNSDNAKIDAAIKAQADALSAETAARTALAAQVAKKGNCQIYYKTYAGDGETSMTHTFPGKPLFVAFGPVNGTFYNSIVHGMQRFASYDGRYSTACGAAWTDNSVTVSGNTGDIGYMCNGKDIPYVMVALLVMDE